MGYRLGIDLGTTFTSAATLRDGRIDVVRLGSRREEIPSVLFMAQDGTLFIGDAAEQRGLAEPSRMAREFKRRMGDPVSIMVGGAPFSGHALTGRLLASVVNTVAEQQGGAPAMVTIAHPANWGPYKLELLRQAIRFAGLEKAQLCSEPEAAAVNYAAGEQVLAGEIIAVYDLGGGTFDAAVLRKTADGFEVIGRPEGIEQLGGIDFDEAVFRHVMAAITGSTGAIDTDDVEMTAALARLRRDCVEAKEALSYDTQTAIPVALPGLHTTVRLTRGELEQMIRPALSDTLSAMHRALNTAAVTPEQLSRILLAGGSSRIPLVAEMVGNEFRRPTAIDAHPEQSIAMGAVRMLQPPAESMVASESTAVIDTIPADHATVSDGRRSPWWLASTAVVLVLIGVAVAIVQPWRSSSGVAGQGVGVTGSSESSAAEVRPSTESPSTAVPDAALTSTATAPCEFRDDFDGGTVDPSWNQVRQNGDFTMENGSLTISAQDGADIFDDLQGAPMLLRVPTGDFMLETEVTAQPDQFYQGAGLVLWTGPQQYVRLERGFGNVGAIVFEYRDGGGHVKVHSPVLDDPQLIQTDAASVVLQLSKTASSVNGRWRPADETQWQELGSIPIAMPDSAQAGIAVLNRAQGGAVPADFSATFAGVRTACE